MLSRKVVADSGAGGGPGFEPFTVVHHLTSEFSVGEALRGLPLSPGAVVNKSQRAGRGLIYLSESVLSGSGRKIR